jgi:D-inositol-3-phosphate glycosyltransferase
VKLPRSPRIGLVVPSLGQGGGVPAVARFLKDTILRSRFDLRLVSLSTSVKDAHSLRLSTPTTWWRGARVVSGEWEGLPMLHVGAVAGELEFQRYRPRSALSGTLADCDIVQVVCGSPAWANAVCGLGKPVAVHCATRAKVERRRRDGNPNGLAGWWRRGMTRITDRMDDRALRNVDAIQVMNPWMLEYVQRLNAGREVDVRYAPPGVDAHLFEPVTERGLDGDRHILCVGRLDDPRKNIGLLLDAYAHLPQEVRQSTRLVLAGLSGPPEAFWRRAEVLGLRERISYVARPDRDALVRLYQGASVFALPSDEEGFGMVLLEAMACGVPVVSTRSGGPDGIITDGEDGYLVPLDDAATMAARLESLLQNPAHNTEMGRKARQTIERRYDERVAGEAFIDIWDRMAHKAGIG